MNIINAKIPMLLASIEKVETIVLESYEIINIISIKRELLKASEIVAETQEKILASYDLKSNDGVYTWSHHEKADEISSKIQELMKSESVISTISLVDHDRFFASVKGLGISEIEELAEILIIKS